jgi:hypothetical protein
MKKKKKVIPTDFLNSLKVLLIQIRKDLIMTKNEIVNRTEYSGRMIVVINPKKERRLL